MVTFQHIFFIISVWIGNLNVLALKVKKKWKKIDAFSLFDALISERRKINTIYGNSTIADSTVCKWFTRSLSLEVENLIWNKKKNIIPASLKSLIMTKLKFWLKTVLVTQHRTMQNSWHLKATLICELLQPKGCSNSHIQIIYVLLNYI